MRRKLRKRLVDIRSLLDKLDASMITVNEVRRYVYARTPLSIFLLF